MITSVARKVNPVTAGFVVGAPTISLGVYKYRKATEQRRVAANAHAAYKKLYTANSSVSLIPKVRPVTVIQKHQGRLEYRTIRQ